MPFEGSLVVHLTFSRVASTHGIGNLNKANPHLLHRQLLHPHGRRLMRYIVLRSFELHLTSSSVFSSPKIRNIRPLNRTSSKLSKISALRGTKTHLAH